MRRFDCLRCGRKSGPGNPRVPNTSIRWVGFRTFGSDLPELLPGTQTKRGTSPNSRVHAALTGCNPLTLNMTTRKINFCVEEVLKRRLAKFPSGPTYQEFYEAMKDIRTDVREKEMQRIVDLTHTEEVTGEILTQRLQSMKVVAIQANVVSALSEVKVYLAESATVEAQVPVVVAQAAAMAIPVAVAQATPVPIPAAAVDVAVMVPVAFEDVAEVQVLDAPVIVVAPVVRAALEAAWRAPIEFWCDHASFVAAGSSRTATVNEGGVTVPKKRLDGFTFAGKLGTGLSHQEAIFRKTHVLPELLQLPTAIIRSGRDAQPCAGVGAASTTYALELAHWLDGHVTAYELNMPGATVVQSKGIYYVGQSSEDERQIVGRNSERLDKDHFIQLERFSVRKAFEGTWAITKCCTNTAAFFGCSLPQEEEYFWHCPAVTTVCLTHGDPVEGVVSKFNWAGVLNLDSRIISDLLVGTQKAVECARVLFRKPLN